MVIRKLFSGLFQGAAVADDVAHTVDHAPVATAEPDRRAQLRNARRRHGKPFRTHQAVQRVTPASHQLEELNRKSARVPAPQIVTPIGARRKS